jgi:hypothetical protein
MIAKIPALSPIANLSAPTAVGCAALGVPVVDGAGSLMVGAPGEAVPGLLEGTLGAVALGLELEGTELGGTLARALVVEGMTDDVDVAVEMETVRETDVETETDTEGVEDLEGPGAERDSADAESEEKVDSESDKESELRGC